ncbi:FkbM family methyltransferase [Mycolicibacterium sp. S2-37]|nr:FkbM family methyltransferase [Mycolicibacterium sp. S2-37]
MDAIRLCSANTLIDIGANKGQFSLAFRSLRPDARIIAFEPLKDAADVYERLFAADGSAELLRVALGKSEDTARFHVADRADSSSLLKPGLNQARAFGVRPAQEIDVPVKRLDQCIDPEALKQPIFMKVDVQGGELDVFLGSESLANAQYVYVELSFIELYEGQPLFREVSEHLIGRGYKVAGFYNQVSTPEFGPTQVDVLFERAESLD